MAKFCTDNSSLVFSLLAMCAAMLPLATAISGQRASQKKPKRKKQEQGGVKVVLSRFFPQSARLMLVQYQTKKILQFLP